jgi:hypothetical protein
MSALGLKNPGARIQLPEEAIRMNKGDDLTPLVTTEFGVWGLET